MNYIENQNWRYATKKFDPNKKVSDEDLDFIKKAIQLSVSSYGLQLYKVLIIEDKTASGFRNKIINFALGKVRYNSGII